jgi:hypothetical protein
MLIFSHVMYIYLNVLFYLSILHLNHRIKSNVHQWFHYRRNPFEKNWLFTIFWNIIRYLFEENKSLTYCFLPVRGYFKSFIWTWHTIFFNDRTSVSSDHSEMYLSLYNRLHIMYLLCYWNIWNDFMGMSSSFDEPADWRYCY